MRSTTARFLSTVVASHQIAVNVDVLYNRAVVRSGLAVAAGTVTFDRTAAQMGSCAVTFTEPLLMPTRTGGLLSPFGYELAISRGVTYLDGTTELVPLGIYPIQVSTPEAVTLTTEVAAVDRSQLVVDARLEDDYFIAAGTNYATAIQALIADGVAGLTYAFVSTTYTTPTLVFPAQSDRWKAAQQMATSIGCELLFDGLGQLVLRPEPTFTNLPVWTISEGDGGLLVTARLSLDRGPAYNRVVATGENTGNTGLFRGVWTDTEPSSPTYYDGPFGHKPRFYASPFITSDAQAAAAAAAIGAALVGVARSLDFSAVPNPALEVGDAVQVAHAALGLNEVHLIDRLTIDLSAAGAMTGQSRTGV